MAMLYIPHLTTTAQQYFTSDHISGTAHHTTSRIFNTTRSHITWRDVDSVAWNLVSCGRFYNARCGMLRLIHPNVAVMWNKVRCRTCAIWCGKCDVVQCPDVKWLCDVEWWCGRWGMWWRAVMRCEMCLWNTEWCAMFCNARCGMLCLIHPNVAVMWNKVRCRICAISVMMCNVRCEV